MSFSPRTYSRVIRELLDYGEMVPSERGNTIELQDHSFRISNPRDRIVTEKWRKINIGFAIVDALSFIIGDNTLAPITQFVPAFSQFSTNGRTIDGSYGNRIHTAEQLDVVIELLKRNPETRRAVISIYMGPVDLLGGGGLNTPCTLNLMFLVREGRLNMKAIMRSNDVNLGLVNDIFTFTMLQEYVSIKTGIPLGSYSHYAASFHMYEKDTKLFNKEIFEEVVWHQTMNHMPHGFEPERLFKILANASKLNVQNCIDAQFSNEYDRNLFLAAAFVLKRKEVESERMLTFISDPTLKLVSGYWRQDK